MCQIVCRQIGLWSAAMLGGALLPPSAVANHLEAQMHVITDWTTECTGTDLSYWDDMVDFWYNEIDDHGWYHRNWRRVDGNFDRDLLCDPDTGLANCNDGAGIDSGDAVMIGLHGADSENHWRGSLRRNGGSSVNDCRIDAPEAGSGEMFVGDADMEFLHFSSCNSMDDDNITQTWRLFSDPVDSPVNGRRLHQATGFHGLMWIGGCCDDQYEDFAADAFAISIKDAWMSNMFVTGINGTATQCPVAYAVGANRSDCFNRIDNERYNNVFSDPSSTAHYCYYYYDGCDPDGESAFTDPN
jgi:Family of unknown function (DUF6345)